MRNYDRRFTLFRREAGICRSDFSAAESMQILLGSPFGLPKTQMKATVGAVGF